MRNSLFVLAAMTVTTGFSLFSLDQVVFANEETPVGESVNASFEARLLSFDRNEDGLLQRSELPASNHKKFDAWDHDQNGVLDQGEQDVLIYFEKNGELPEGELRGQIENETISDGLVLENGYYRRAGPGVTVGEFVGRALTFDEDKNGSLSKDELIKMAEVFVQVEQMNRARRSQANRVTNPDRASSRSGAQVRDRQSYLSNLHSQVQLPNRRPARPVGVRTRGNT